MMKKYYPVLFWAFLCLTMFASCSKKHCYEPMYDNPPALSENGYNTCKAVLYNFSAYNGTVDEQFFLAERDTIKICGYLHSHVEPDRTWYTLADEPMSLNADPEIELNVSNLRISDSTTIDVSKKCYITGRLGFEEHPYHANNYGACLKWIPCIAVTIDCFFE